MEDLFKPNCIRTFSGKYVNVFEPTHDMIDIVDIAHALSNQCRFGGHLKKFYSVAQHSIICSELAPKEYKLCALLHDASEYALIDFPRPIKNKIKDYLDIESNLMKFISEKYGFQYPLPKSVVDIDDLMLKHEWNSLMLKNESFNYIILTRKQAEQQFIRTFKQLKNN